MVNAVVKSNQNAMTSNSRISACHPKQSNVKIATAISHHFVLGMHKYLSHNGN